MAAWLAKLRWFNKDRDADYLHVFLSAAEAAHKGGLGLSYPSPSRFRWLVDPRKAGSPYGRMLREVIRESEPALEELARELAPGMHPDIYYRQFTELRIEWIECCLKAMWKRGDPPSQALAVYAALDDGGGKIVVTHTATGRMHPGRVDTTGALTTAWRNTVGGLTPQMRFKDERTNLLVLVTEEVRAFVQLVFGEGHHSTKGPELVEWIPGTGIFRWRP